MCVKYFLKDLNFNYFPLYFTNTYTRRMTIIPKVYDGNLDFFKGVFC